MNSSVPDAVWYTMVERKEVNLPKNLLVIYDANEVLCCLDYNCDEPCVVEFVPGIDISQQKYNIVAKNFGDFLLDLVSLEQ